LETCALPGLEYSDQARTCQSAKSALARRSMVD
jgi:hypothetical protein